MVPGPILFLLIYLGKGDQSFRESLKHSIEKLERFQQLTLEIMGIAKIKTKIGESVNDDL